jgi:hypothetical protein
MTAYIDTTTTGTFKMSPTIAYPTGLRNGCGDSYGITADARGRVWMAGWTCEDAIGYDPKLKAWTRQDTTRFGLYAGRGITVDAAGLVWMAMAPPGDGQSYLVSWRADAFNPGGVVQQLPALFIMPAGYQGPSGVGADSEGNIWLGHYKPNPGANQLVKLNPQTGTIQSFAGSGQIYTYSDFTGSIRREVIGRGTYQETVDSGCTNAVKWDQLAWDADTPLGSTVNFTIRTAATSTGALAATPIDAADLPLSTSPVDLGPLLTTSSVTPARFLVVNTTLKTNVGGQSPIVRAYTVSWNCQ